jgi:predicted PurR-regulated permease PerM
LLLIGVPTVILGSSFAGHIHETYLAFKNNTVVVPQPDPGVAQWPLVGDELYTAWQAAATDLPAYLETLQPQLANFTRWMLATAASTAGSVLLFLGALIVSGIILAYGESGSQAMLRIFSRLAGPARGAKLHALSTATVRSVATGVIGVAFIQALLLGIGFLLAGVGAAGILALVVLLLGIMQLPVILVSLPVVAYLWLGTDASTLSNTLFTVYLLLAGVSDNVLKPMLLGRGVDVPMPVILLGALGGMVSDGILGLFVGAALLAAGYQLFMEWVNEPGVTPSGVAPTTDQQDLRPA